MRAFLVGAGLSLMGATLPPAMAHTAYMKPSLFWVLEGDVVTVEASFTSRYMSADAPVRSDDFHVIRPDGSHNEIDQVIMLTQATYLEERLPLAGTYRITSGERLGRKSDFLLLADGRYTPARIDDTPVEIPRGATVVSSQTATVSDVYVTRGETPTPLNDERIGRLAITPLSHPNRFTVDAAVQFQVSFDGAPLKGETLTLYRDGGHYDGVGGEFTVLTDDKGIASIEVPAPGLYVAMARRQAPAPEGAATDIRSYTTSVTFEVLLP